MVRKSLIVNFLVAQSTFNPYSAFGLGEPQVTAYSTGLGLGRSSLSLSAVNPYQPAHVPLLGAVSIDLSGYVRNQVLYTDQRARFGSGSTMGVGFSFPFAQTWGLTVGGYPYTQVGYNFETPQPQNGIVLRTAQKGEGGIAIGYLGIAKKIQKIALGYQIGRGVGTVAQRWDFQLPTQSLPDYYVGRQYWRFWENRFGMIYTDSLGKNLFQTSLTTAFYTPLKSENLLILQKNQAVNLVIVDTLANQINTRPIQPHIGIGISWARTENWLGIVEFHYQNWRPWEKGYRALWHGHWGVQYLPNPRGKAWERFFYQVGGWYAQFYYPTPRPYTVAALTAGVGITLPRQASRVYVAFEAGKANFFSGATLRENFFQVSVGAYFREVWFLRSRID
ncbi:MAG: hypothetical protein ACUVRD_03155 [Bacteroidia bacterium]